VNLAGFIVCETASHSRFGCLSVLDADGVDVVKDGTNLHIGQLCGSRLSVALSGIV